MRRPVLLLVVLLLVLRGGFGDALAMRVPAAVPAAALVATVQHCGDAAALSAESAHEAGPGHADAHGAGQGPAHHGVAAAPAPGAAGLHADGSPPPADCGESPHATHAGCGDCQACHSAIPAVGAGVALPAIGPQAIPACVPAAFASADRARDLRPPIAPVPRP